MEGKALGPQVLAGNGVLASAEVIKVPQRMDKCCLLRKDERNDDEHMAPGTFHGAESVAPKKYARWRGRWAFIDSASQSPYIFCFSSRRAWASMVSVAVGRASRRGMPMGSPVSSHQP